MLTASLRPVAAGLTLLTAGALAVGPARGADATAEQAAQLEQGISAWLADTLGPGIKLPERPVRVQPAGDAYRLVVPFGSANPPLTAALREAENGTWALRDLKTPSPSRFSIDLPDPSGVPGATVRTDYVLSWGEQDTSALFDPSYRTTSTLTWSSRASEMRATSGGQQSMTRIARSAGQSELRPEGDGRVDVITDSTAEGYSTSSPLPDGQLLQLDAERMLTKGVINGVSRERAPRLLRAVVGLVGGTLIAGPTEAPAAVPTSAELRALFEPMQDLASALQTEQVLQGLRVRVGKFGGGAERARLALNAATPGGILTLSTDILAEGIRAPDLPLSRAQRELVPRRVALRTMMSGVAAADLVRLMLNASDTGEPPQAEDIVQLLSRGGLTVGLESFELDLGGASFTGNVQMSVPPSMAVSGGGQVSATGFEVLLDRIKRVPEFKGALPVIAFAKGIARPVGNQLVWNITYGDGRVLVNDVDLSAMSGGARK